MPNKTLTTKTNLWYMERSEFLASSIRTQKPTVNTDLGVMYGDAFPDGNGPPQPDWDALQEANLALIEGSMKELRQTEQDHRRDQLSLDQLRRDRREQVGELKQEHRSLRDTFAGTYGKESQGLVGLDSAPARAYVAFREQVKVSSERMRDPQLVAQLPEPLHRQKPIDLDSLADGQEGGIERLDGTALAIVAMRKQADESVVAKGEAQKRHRRIYANVARIQEGLYRLAGLDELANRIRATRRTRKAKDAEGEAGEAEQQESQEAPAAEAQAEEAPAQS